MTRKKPVTATKEETVQQPLSRKDFINSVVKKRQKNKFLMKNHPVLLTRHPRKIYVS